MKRINIFKSRLDTLDRNPILKKILERDSYDESEIKKEQEEENKKSKDKLEVANRARKISARGGICVLFFQKKDAAPV
jgi:hypothetical protein